MLNVGPGELLAILVLALIVLGPDKLPDAIRTVGRVVGELRRISGGFQEELRSALEDHEVQEDLERLRNTDRPELPPLDPAAEATVADHEPDDDKDPSIDDEAVPVADPEASEAPEVDHDEVPTAAVAEAPPPAADGDDEAPATEVQAEAADDEAPAPPVASVPEEPPAKRDNGTEPTDERAAS